MGKVSEFLRTRRVGLAVRAAILCLVSFVLASCGGQAPSTAPPTTIPSATTAIAPYRSTTFVVPFDVAAPSWLGASSLLEQSNFVTWEASDGATAVRVLAPVSVYAPASAKPSAPPEDYLAYLLAQSEHGAEFTEEAQTTVGGQPTTVLTANGATNLNGSLGCQKLEMDAHDCFGIESSLTLRLAVLKVREQVLLIWLRTNRDADPSATKAATESFDGMLASFQFSGRRVESPSPTTSNNATPIDGMWSILIPKKELAESPLLMDGEPVDGNWGRWTLTFKQGNGRMKDPVNPDAVPFTYGVEDDVLTMTLGSEAFIVRWRINGNQLTLLRDESLGVGPTPFVLKPWTRGF